MPGQGKMLIVDDDTHIRRLLSLHLRRLPYEIHEAGSGEDAIQLMSEHQFDVVLLDLILPYYGGFNLCQRLKSEQKRAPYVIIITGEESPETRSTAEECGADDFIAKPFDVNDVIQRIELLPVHHAPD